MIPSECRVLSTIKWTNSNEVLVSQNHTDTTVNVLTVVHFLQPVIIAKELYNSSILLVCQIFLLFSKRAGEEKKRE